MTITRLFGTIAIALCLGLLTSCEKPVKPPLAFGAKVWPGSEPLYLARELGYVPAEQVRLAEYASTDEVKQAFRNHAIHLAGVTLEDALALRRDVPDLKIVLVFDQARAPARTFDVMVTRDEDIGDYHSEMVQLAQGWARALDYVHAAPAKATALMARHDHLEPVQFDQAMQGIELFGVQRNRELMLGDTPGIASAVTAAQRVMMDQGLLSFGVEPAMLLDASLLAGIAR